MSFAKFFVLSAVSIGVDDSNGVDDRSSPVMMVACGLVFHLHTTLLCKLERTNLRLLLFVRFLLSA